MDSINELIGRLSGVSSERIETHEPFLDIAARFAGMPGTVLLMSGGDLDSARYHMIGIKPWLTLKGRDKAMTVSVEDESLCVKGDPLDTLQVILKRLKIRAAADALPLKAGLMGYLSYDLKDSLEALPTTTVDNLGLPHICFYAHALILLHDKKENLTTLCISLRHHDAEGDKQNLRDWFYRKLAEDVPPDNGFRGGGNGFCSVFDRDDYINSIQKIQDYINAGDVYQVNLSQRFEMAFTGSGFSLFRSLFQQNPAPFFAYIHAGDHEIVSTSPERFVWQNGPSVETRPIKGTRPRGKTSEADEALRCELKKSKKDTAELSMIVDLLRNDIGKVCRGGSVHVEEHKRLEAYENVFHLISIVRGQLAENKDSVDLIRAIFPGGSITGCPKIRSMEIIDELEPVSRHIYTGSIGYISFHDTMDLSIAIRTATVLNEKILFSVGGGIVFDSVPEDEYEETLHKGRTLVDIFGGQKKNPNAGPVAWANGVLKRQDQVSIPISDLGMSYGYGFFETIRVHKGIPEFLDDHIERFNRAWQHLFFRPPPALTWQTIIAQVIRENHLGENTAVVKIMATYGNRGLPPYNQNLVVTAKPYVSRFTETGPKGACLLRYPEPRQTPLADHKTLNYLYYFLAGQWAKKQGGDEALIMNPDGTASETNTANIIVFEGHTAIIPRSPSVLPGIMQVRVCRILEKWGVSVIKKRVYPEDLFSKQVIMTNSLIGAVPVSRIDDTDLPEPDDTCLRINRDVHQAATS